MFVILAQAGIQRLFSNPWIPACAGMTVPGEIFDMNDLLIEDTATPKTV